VLRDVSKVPAGAELEVPVCVVGAGAAGITLTRRLAQRGISTVLLEAGGEEREEKTQSLYKGRIAGSPYFELHHTRLRYFGGSTNHWTGWCRRLEPIDFEARPWLRYGQWPIGFDELGPYYQPAHEICDLGPVEYSAEYWTQRTGQSALPLDPELATTAFWQFSTPTRFAKKYGEEIREATSVQAYLHANVVDIEPNKHGSRVERVRVKTLSGHEIFVRPRVLVLAGGAIENARLLLASTQGNPAGLGNRHDVVGRYFMEHPHANIGALLTTVPPSELELYDDIYRLGEDAPPPAVRGALTVPPAVMRKEGLMGFSAALEPKLRLPPLGRELTAGVEQLLRDLQRVEPERTYQLYLRCEQAPRPDSRVLLDQKVDALGMRRAALDWRLDRDSIASMKRSMELVAAAIGKAGLGRIYSFFHANDELRSGAWPAFTGGHHHMGTTRMGHDPEVSVVDGNCRVHGIDNLYVAGSSVFTTGGFGNPTLTIVALALRLGDHLERTL
jgi:choline dehydrogenase-like flavoprotein